MNSDDVGGDVFIGDLPPHNRNRRDRHRPLMLKALQHHRQNPNLPEHKGWFLVYSRKQEWIESIPREYCVEGAISMEDIDNDLRGQQRKWRKRLAKAEPELGRFSVKRRQGEIWVKHVGILPETDQHNNWG